MIQTSRRVVEPWLKPIQLNTEIVNYQLHKKAGKSRQPLQNPLVLVLLLERSHTLHSARKQVDLPPAKAGKFDWANKTNKSNRIWWSGRIIFIAVLTNQLNQQQMHQQTIVITTSPFATTCLAEIGWLWICISWSKSLESHRNSCQKEQGVWPHPY